MRYQYRPLVINVLLKRLLGDERNNFRRWRYGRVNDAVEKNADLWLAAFARAGMGVFKQYPPHRLIALILAFGGDLTFIFRF